MTKLFLDNKEYKQIDNISDIIKNNIDTLPEGERKAILSDAEKQKHLLEFNQGGARRRQYHKGVI